MINQDVPQEVVRRILDHDSSQMTGHYARLHDTTVRPGPAERFLRAAGAEDLPACQRPVN